MAKRKQPGKRQALVRASPLAAHPDFAEVLALIDAARAKAAAAVNTELIDLYWQIGEHLSRRIADGAWGEGTVKALAEHSRRRQPTARGFSAQNLSRMRQFYETYRAQPKLSALLRELPWTHNLFMLGKCKREEEREFSAQYAAQERHGIGAR